MAPHPRQLPLADLYTQLLLSKTEEALDRPAVQSGEDLLLTYRDLVRLVDSLERVLGEAGVRAGDRVVLVLPNSPEYIVSFLAITAAAAIVVPVDPGAGSERLRFIAEDTEARLCLRLPGAEADVEASVPSFGLELDVKEMRARLIPSSDSAPHRSGEGAPGRGTEEPGERPPAGRGADHAAPMPAMVSADAGIRMPAAILYTAGSTGRPKGAVLEHKHFLAIARTLSSIIGMSPSHRDLILSPMTHSGGWQRVLSTFLAGGCVVIPRGVLTVPAILEAVQAHGITAFFATPPLLRAILMSPPVKVRQGLSILRSIETASAPLASFELETLMELLPSTNVFVQYGLTECSRAFILDGRAHPDKLHTVGRATQGVTAVISGEDGSFLGPGEEGEILLAAPQRAEGYWNQPGFDRDRFRGPWLLTGDFGRLDADGFLTFVGRRDDMINCGGHSYFPVEVEIELGPQETIKEYLIAGVPDPQKVLNQVPWAFVVPRDPEGWSPEGFLALARRKLPAHKVPRRVVVIAALPTTGPGKPSRRLAVERYGPSSESKAP